MKKTLSAMVAAATLCLASQASAGTVTFAAGANVATGISGIFGAITYTTTSSFGSGGFDNGNTNGVVQGNGFGMGVNATPNPTGANTFPDAGYRNVIDTRVVLGQDSFGNNLPAVSVDGAWEMLTITFSEAVNLANFILGKIDEDDDFEYSFDSFDDGDFISVRGSRSDLPFDPDFVVTQADKTYTMEPWTYVTTFSIRATGVGAFDNDDFALKSAEISAVPLPAGAPLLLAGLAGLALLRRRKRAA